MVNGSDDFLGAIMQTFEKLRFMAAVSFGEAEVAAQGDDAKETVLMALNEALERFEHMVLTGKIADVKSLKFSLKMAVRDKCDEPEAYAVHQVAALMVRETFGGLAKNICSGMVN